MTCEVPVGARLPAMNDNAVCLKHRSANIAGKRAPTDIMALHYLRTSTVHPPVDKLST